MPEPETEAAAATTTHQVALQAAGIHLFGPWWAAECVDPAGQTSYWLLNVNDEPRGSWRASMAPHEGTGPLPREWRDRLALTCAGTTREGRPCRKGVMVEGAFCTHHRAQADA